MVEETEEATDFIWVTGNFFTRLEPDSNKLVHIIWTTQNMNEWLHLNFMSKLYDLNLV